MRAALRWTAGMVVVALVVWLAAHAAPGREVEPPESAREEAHPAKGEVRYEETWTPITQVFETYREARAKMEELVEQGRPVRGALTDLNWKINKLRGEALAKERPLHADLSKVRAKMRKAARTLSIRPPREPQYQPMPTEPKRSRYRDEGEYDDALRRYRREVKRIREGNEKLKQEYERNLETYNKMRAEAKETIQENETTIADCEKQVETIQQELDEAQRPLLEERKRLNTEIATLVNQARALITRADALADAMRSAPEDVRFRLGIIEWEGEFYTLEKLEALHAETQAEIDRTHEQLKEQAKLAGRDFPEDWRHPQQDRMDALKSLIERAKAVRGGTASSP
ncbi:MAG: hypothetical protein WBD05_09365 [Phycisphaerae bacterium]